MVVTEVRCDRCKETIPEGQCHVIQWGEITPEAEPSDLLIADLCEHCYDVLIRQDLAQYGYKPVLDLGLFNKKEELK